MDRFSRFRTAFQIKGTYRSCAKQF